MKIRNGWVSNSSTSSFVGVFGKVADIEAAKKFIKLNSKFNFVIYTGKELEKELEKRPYWLSFAALHDFKGVSVRPSVALLNKNDRRAYFITLDYRIDEHELPIKISNEFGDILLDKSYDESNADVIKLVDEMKEDSAFKNIKTVYYWDRW